MAQEQHDVEVRMSQLYLEAYRDRKKCLDFKCGIWNCDLVTSNAPSPKALPSDRLSQHAISRDRPKTLAEMTPEGRGTALLEMARRCIEICGSA